MRVIHVPETLPDPRPSLPVRRSIFLAGPTPRSEDVPSWRPTAIRILRELGHTGVVFVPETEDWGWAGDYDQQVMWEWRALGRSQCIVFWVPRDLKDMPALTTNVEFGMMVMKCPHRVVLGTPTGTPKMNYLLTMCEKQPEFVKAFGTAVNGAESIPTALTLRATLELAMGKMV